MESTLTLHYSELLFLKNLMKEYYASIEGEELKLTESLNKLSLKLDLAEAEIKVSVLKSQIKSIK